jgi:hypothetical protein
MVPLSIAAQACCTAKATLGLGHETFLMLLAMDWMARSL